MLYFFLFVVVIIVFFNVIQSAEAIGFLLKVFLIALSFLTPFWPMVLIGYYLKFRLQNNQASARQHELNQLNRTKK